MIKFSKQTSEQVVKLPKNKSDLTVDNLKDIVMSLAVDNAALHAEIDGKENNR